MHDPMSTVRCPFWTLVQDSLSRADSLATGLRGDYCICIICDCVPRNFWPTYEDSVRRSLLPPRASSAVRASSSVFRELYQSHFAPGSCSLVASSRFVASCSAPATPLPRDIVCPSPRPLPIFFRPSATVRENHSVPPPTASIPARCLLRGCNGEQERTRSSILPRDRATTVDTTTANSSWRGFLEWLSLESDDGPERLAEG